MLSSLIVFVTQQAIADIFGAQSIILCLCHVVR